MQISKFLVVSKRFATMRAMVNEAGARRRKKFASVTHPSARGRRNSG